jgi:hypothetical protein
MPGDQKTEFKEQQKPNNFILLTISKLYVK